MVVFVGRWLFRGGLKLRFDSKLKLKFEHYLLILFEIKINFQFRFPQAETTGQAPESGTGAQPAQNFEDGDDDLYQWATEADFQTILFIFCEFSFRAFLSFH